MVDWSQVLGDVLTQVLRIVLPVCVALVAKWAVELYLKIKEEQPNVVPLLDYFVEQAVFAAEMIYGSGHGEEKKKYAKAVVTRWLADHGLSVNIDIISDAIEAEVYKQFHHYTVEIEEAEEEIAE